MPDGPMSEWIRQRDAQEASSGSGSELFTVGSRVALGAMLGAMVAVGICISSGQEIDLTGVLGTAVAGGLAGLATTIR